MFAMDQLDLEIDMSRKMDFSSAGGGLSLDDLFAKGMARAREG